MQKLIYTNKEPAGVITSLPRTELIGIVFILLYHIVILTLKKQALQHRSPKAAKP